MEYILTKHNFWDLAPYMKRAAAVYYKEAPQYILSFLNSNNVNIVQSDKKPESAVLKQGHSETWPTEDELTEEIFNWKYYIDDSNYSAVLSSVLPTDELIYSESLTKKIPDGLKKRFVSKKTPELMPKERIMLTTPRTRNSDIALLNEIPPEYDIIHFIGAPVSNVKYRRHHFNSWLKSHYKTATVYSGTCDVAKAKKVIVSDPRGANSLIIAAAEKGIPVYYDRTDNWNALYPHSEAIALNYSKAVTCSSRYLADEIGGYLVESGAEEWKYTPTQKQKIVVYVGKAMNKTDDEFCNRLKNEHPDYEYFSIGAPIEGWKHIGFMSRDMMMRFLEKCEIGIIPLKDTDYFKGQLNIKIWDYLQAHLKVLVNNSYNYKSFPNVHTSFDEAAKAEFVPFKLVRWDDVFSQIMELYK